MMERLRRRGSDGHAASLGKLLWQTPGILLALYIVTKVGLRFAHARHWYQFGRIGLVSRLVHHWERHDIAAAQRRWQQAEILAAENAAVVRVTRAVVRELAQPLSGALCYSEMLMPRIDRLDDDMKTEVMGLREGVLRLERLLFMLRAAVDEAPSASDAHLADAVERIMVPHTSPVSTSKHHEHS